MLGGFLYTECMNIEEMKAIVAECDANKTAHLFKSVTAEVPSWDEFIAHLDYEYNHEQSQVSNDPSEETMIGGVCLRNNFYMSVRNPEAFGFSHLKEVTDIFDEVLGEKGYPVSAFINFVGKEKPIKMHIDNRISVYWQCQGSALWQISSGPNQPVLEYRVEPGDVMYVPKHVLHSVVTDTPRSAITMAYNADPYHVYYSGDN